VQPTAFVWSDLLQLFCHCYQRRTSSSPLRARAPANPSRDVHLGRHERNEVSLRRQGEGLGGASL